nr:hypothetical protein [Desulfobulbaceae bacterium]
MKTILFTLFALAHISLASAAVIDAPHTADNGVSCSSCHAYSLWWEFSPTDYVANRDTVIIETLCNSCHDGNGSAPFAVTHSSGAMLPGMHNTAYGDWTRSCLDCHNPHFQLQLQDWLGDASVQDTELYLTQGTIGTIIDNLDGTSTFNYTLTAGTTKPAWGLPENWTKKTSANRGLLVAVSNAQIENTYKITSATEDTPGSESGFITVNGVISSADFDGENFGLIYGQYIRKEIPVDQNRDGNFNLTDVKFFDGKGGFVRDEKDGICQVCHSQTLHFQFNDDPPHPHLDVQGVSNAATLQCTTCHAHDFAFGHGADGGSSCAGCHNDASDFDNDSIFTISKHEAHLNIEIVCSKCHDLANMSNASGDIILDLATTTVCSNCHHDGTDLDPINGNNPPNTLDYKTGWLTPGYSFTCAGCHGLPPSYTGTPKANSHIAHANDGITCENCHYSTTEDGLSLLGEGTHTNNFYDVVAAPGVSLTYSEGSCSNISCHLGNGADWGQEFTCLNCHQNPANDIDIEGVIDPNAVAQINMSQWFSSGHGRPSNTTYVGSGFNGAGLTCYYCHDTTIAHGSAVTPYRLVNIDDSTNGMNGVCWACHKSTSSGYNPPYPTMPAITSILKVDSYHGYNEGLGGKFCWDCHDPHGDSNIFMIHDNVSLRSDKITGVPTLQSQLVEFSDNSTGADYAKSTAPFNGICNVCHLNTQYYTSSSGNIAHDAGQVCTNCHNHTGGHVDTAFSVGECLDCHNQPQEIASAPGTFRRQIDIEFPQTTETAGSAHAHFGGDLDSDDCRVCHYQIYHRVDGKIRLWGGDKEVQINLQGELENTSIVYIGDNVDNIKNIEAQKYEDISDFCMSCHDADGMNSSPYPFDPFGNGNAPPDAATAFKGSRNASGDYQNTILGVSFGTGRAVLSHHPLSKADQDATGGTKIECTNCHGVHSASKANKLVDPDNRSNPWSPGPDGKTNPFCLKCHDGGMSPGDPKFPTGVNGPLFNPTTPLNTPGSPCDTDSNPLTVEVWDCSDTCDLSSTITAWRGDTYCDAGFYGLDLTCSTFNYDDGDCGSSPLENGVSLLKGLEQCDGYSNQPWTPIGDRSPWSLSAHGQGTKRRWAGYEQNPQIPTYELDCLDCHEYHGSYSANNTFGNPYMIRDFIDGSGYVDDGNIHGVGDQLSCTDAALPSPDCQFGTSGEVIIDKPNFKKNDDGSLDSATFNGWTGFCSKCHSKWLTATSSGAHDINSGFSSCLTCHGHGIVYFGAMDLYQGDPDNTPDILCP